MSVAGITSSMVSPYLQSGPANGTSPSTTNTRQQEDAAAKELITDLRKGDLSGAQSAYNTLASFGANNSGPWAQGSQMQQSFQQLGQDLASGNLNAARGDAKGMAQDQLSSDMSVAQQDYKSGNMTAYSQAMQNYQSDYWAIFGQSSPSVQGNPSPASTVGVNITA